MSGNVDALIEAHVRHVLIAARKMKRRLPKRIDVQELYADGLVGLVLAAREYREGEAPTFWAFAHQRVTGAMVDGMRSFSSFNRRLRRSPERVTLTDTFSIPPDVDERRWLSECSTIVKRRVRTLPAREKRLFCALLHGRKQRDIARSLGVTQGRVAQLKARIFIHLESAPPKSNVD